MVGSGLTNDERTRLSGEGKESLVINTKYLVYIKSDDNYVDLYLQNEDEILEKRTIRATLKMIEEQLNQHPEFFRVHRSYIVNIGYVKNIGKKGTVLIKLSHTEISLPVSKSYQESVAQLFIHHKF